MQVTLSAEAEGFSFYDDDNEKGDLTNRQVTNGERRRRTPPKASTASEFDGRPRKRISIGNVFVDSPFDVPLELWFEIFNFLYPIDLLHLSRACKLFRGWLKHDSALLTWKAAYRNLPCATLVEPPSESDIVRWSNFLFGKHCHVCGSSRGNIVHWSTRARFCARCAENELIYVKRGVMDRWPLAMQNYRALRLPRALCPYEDEGDPWTEVELDCSDNEERAVTLKAFVERCKREISKVKSLDEQEQTKFIAGRIETAKSAMLLGQKLYGWKQTYDRKLTEEREGSLVKKLTSIGYGELALRHIREVRKVKGVKIPISLTDEAWDSMRNPLLRVLTTSTLSSRLQILEETLRNFADNIPKGYLYPPPAVVAQHPSFLKLLRDTPVTDDIDSGDIIPLLPVVEDMTEKWSSEVLVTLCRVMPGGAEAIAANPNGSPPVELRQRLELATTWFSCHHCKVSEPISYPRILFHRCLRSRPLVRLDLSPSDDEEIASPTSSDLSFAALSDSEQSARLSNRVCEGTEPTVEELWDGLEDTKKGLGWNTVIQDISWYNQRAYDRATALLQASGLDPETTTQQQLQQADPRLYCGHCAFAKGTPVWVNWTTAFLHDLSHEKDVNATWVLATEEEAMEAKKWESTPFVWPWQEYMCRHCYLTIRTDLQGHLMQKHGYSMQYQTDMEQHFHLPIDATLRRPPFGVDLSTREYISS